MPAQSGFSAVIRSRNALLITDTELRLIAKAPIIGDKSQPVNGNSTPAANGTPSRSANSPANAIWLRHGTMN